MPRSHIRTRDGDSGAEGPVTVFLHLPKTGGTTLREIVRRSCGRDSVLELDSADAVEAFKRAPEDQRARPRVIQGHLTIGLHHFIPAPCRYVTLLRDPIERVVSAYFWLRHTPEHPQHELAMRLSLGDFAVAAEDPDFDNGQTRLLSSLGPDRSRPCDERDLAEAEANLRSPLMAVVGVTERFDETLALIQLTLGWPPLRYMDANVTRGRPRLDDLDPAALAAIEERNRFDRALHDAAGKLLDEHAAHLGTEFDARLRRLRRQSRWLRHASRARTVIADLRHRAARMTA